MFLRKKWLAVIDGDSWTIAKVGRSKQKLKIYRLIELKYDNSQEKFRELIKKNGLKNKKMDIALSCSGIITRIITLPLLKSKELEKLLTDQVDQYFTLNVEDYIIDYRILEIIEEEGQKRQKILLAAIPKYKWEDYNRVWESCGIRPERVDLAADALARLYHKKLTIEDPNDIAIVELNEHRIQFILLQQGTFFLYSDQEVDLSELRVDMDVLATEEHESKHKTMLEIEQIMTPMLQTLSEFINFFSARHYGKRIDHVYITGTFANTPWLAQIIETNINIDTSAGFPRNWKPKFAQKAMESKGQWLKYGSLYGLAYRED